MQLWYRADDGALINIGGTGDVPAADGDLVEGWLDKSNNSYHAIQYTTNRRPIFDDPATNYNGQPALSFDGSDSHGDYMSPGNVLNQGTNSFTVFTVFSSPSRTVAANEMLIEKRETSGTRRDRFTLYLRPSASTPSLQFLIGDGTNAYGALVGTDYSALLNAQPHISAGVVDRAGNTLYHYLDGGTPGTADITGLGTQSNSNSFYIGRGTGGTTDTWEGHIAEILMYQGALTADELNAVGYYLQAKYGVDGSYVVPEPSMAIVLLLGGASALVFWRRRR